MLVRFLIYAWILSIFLSMAIAADRGQPLARAFYPILGFKALCWEIILIVWCGILSALHYFDCPPILGQRPLVWSVLMLVVWVWICLGNYYLHGEVSGDHSDRSQREKVSPRSEQQGSNLSGENNQRQ